MASVTYSALPTTNHTEKVVVKKILWAAPLTGVIAAGLNALVFLLYSAVGFNIVLPLPNPADPTQLATPLSIVFVVVFTFLPALVAGGLLWALTKVSRRPLTLFIALSAVALLLSFSASLPMDMPTAFKLGLDVMHVIAAVVIVGGLVSLTREA